MAADGHLGHKNGHNFATAVPFDVMCLYTCTAVARLTLALAKLSCTVTERVCVSEPVSVIASTSVRELDSVDYQCGLWTKRSA